MFARKGVDLSDARLQPAVLLSSYGDFGKCARMLQDLSGIAEFIDVGGGNGKAVVDLCDFRCGFVFQAFPQVEQVLYGCQIHPALVVVGCEVCGLKAEL